MLSLGLLPFLSLLIVSVVVSLVWYFVVKVKLPGGYSATLIIAWIGAWLGGPILGKWTQVAICGLEVSLVPAILGSIAAILLANACLKK